ncbi:MAG TPA: hypothetical protein ENN27_02925, partial [Candidatus Atribacteria bacterium]|nr:hypothetical protein [Candidatus Atribacteria bacterium]
MKMANPFDDILPQTGQKTALIGPTTKENPFDDIISTPAKKQYKPLFEFIEPVDVPTVIGRTIQEAGAAGGKFLSALGLGLPEYALKRFAGREIPTPPSPAGKILAGIGELAGFVKAPLPLGTKIAAKTPLVARAFRPATTLTQATAKPIIRGATSLGIASALQTPEEGLLAPRERMKQFISSAKAGAVLGGISFIPNKALRMITSSAHFGVPATLREEPLEQQVFKYGLGAWIGRKGGTPRQILAREKPLALLIRDGTDKPKEFLDNAKTILQQEKELALQAGK